MTPLTILTGPRGAGKTSLCLRIIEKAQADGWQVAGLLSPARFERSRKIGIDVLDLRTGQRRPLAQRRTKTTNGALETSNWRFDPDALAWGAEILHQATPCDLLIIDELGPLEFEGKGGWAVALDIITQGDHRRALVVIRPELLKAAQSRWPWAQIWRIEDRGTRGQGDKGTRRQGDKGTRGQGKIYALRTMHE